MRAGRDGGAPHAAGVRWAVLAVATLAGAIGVACTSSGNGSQDARACDANAVSKKALPSVVTIHAGNGSAGSTGSGEVIRSDGYILTNNHVVSIAADGGSIQIVFSDGSTAPASIKGRDPLTDL